ncbi:pyridoxamine 5'-phosphate oxidase family protein [Streptomyces sp. HUAS MG47]|uniref:pyridoxamine 5'-phosphate oxidase family protein n=1 Tax=Streptomyces solicamelliae TaxID=3231716 RepID=UPI00387842C0
MHQEAASASASEPRRRTVALDADEALRLLAGVPLGRIVFTRQALPAVRPVHHLVDGGDVVVRTHEVAALTLQAGTAGVVVAYEADEIDPEARLGWSVVVTGYCSPVTDREEAARYRALLRPWSDRQTDHVVRIHPDLVTGVRLIADRPDPDDRPAPGD